MKRVRGRREQRIYGMEIDRQDFKLFCRGAPAKPKITCGS
jgi:hypothetical protein